MSFSKWGLGIGDWGLGIGDWGLGPIPNPQSPSPIPNPHFENLENDIKNYLFIINKFKFFKIKNEHRNKFKFFISF
jgi:hypothetical protein